MLYVVSVTQVDEALADDIMPPLLAIDAASASVALAFALSIVRNEIGVMTFDEMVTNEGRLHDDQ